MAALGKIGRLSTELLKSNSVAICINRCSSMLDLETRQQVEELYQEKKPYGLKKWMPGVYPRTEEARIKAAEKYGLHPKEYKPVKDDEYSLGDYPELPKESVEAKDPYYPWDFPDIRRNYNEPLHRDFDMMTEDRFAYGVRTSFNYYVRSLICVATFVGYILISLPWPDTKPSLSEKQYPGDGKKYYIFEPAN